MDSAVLLLNSDYEPLNVCNVRRAFRLVFARRPRSSSTTTTTFVPRRGLPRSERHPPPAPRQAPAPASPPVARREIFARDKHTCQYCGARPRPDARPRHPAPPRRRATPGTTSSPRARRATTARAAASLDEARMRLCATAVRAALRRLHAVHAVPVRPAQRGLARLSLRRPQLADRSRPHGAHPRTPAACRASSTRCGRTATRRTSSAAACATRCSATGHATGTWPRPRARSASLSFSADGRYENRFGTVTVPAGDSTSRQRPFGATICTATTADPTRSPSPIRSPRTSRGATSRSTRSHGAASRPTITPSLVDPTDGTADLHARGAARRWRAAVRFDEDALRLLRAARFAAQLDFRDRATDAGRDARHRRDGAMGVSRNASARAAQDGRCGPAVCRFRDPRRDRRARTRRCRSLRHSAACRRTRSPATTCGCTA